MRKTLVMETYVKVRTTKDDTFIRQFATMDDQVRVILIISFLRRSGSKSSSI